MVHPGSRDAAAAAFSELADLVYRGTTFENIYQAICEVALSAVPGCDHACVTTVTAGGEPHREAASDEIALLVDELEWKTGEGPCVDAILSDRYEFDPDISHESVWPELARHVLELTPVRGMVGYRIMNGDRKVGALNLYSDTPGALTEESASMGAIVAAFASVALTAAEQHESAGSLREALDSNREIGKAIGMLMATHQITDEEAFAILRQTSNELNVRLAVVAQQLLSRHGAQSGGTA
jgi:transcriptional regulator with GAF, ATPase, and Fis domain